MIAGWLALWIAAAPVEAEPAFRTARARYDDFEFDDARARFVALLGRADLDDASRARLLVWIGMCDAENGALADAAKAFEDAARRDPDVAPLPSMSPKARRMLDEARERVRRRRPARRPAPVDPGGQDAGTEGEPAHDGRATERDRPPSAGGAPSPSPAARASSPTPLLVAGVGGLAAGGLSTGLGVLLGVGAQDAYAAAADATEAADAQRRYDDAGQLATVANVAYAIAGVTVVVGAVCLVAGALHNDDTAAVDGDADARRAPVGDAAAAQP